jgi:hypothetical protein
VVAIADEHVAWGGRRTVWDDDAQASRLYGEAATVELPVMIWAKREHITNRVGPVMRLT